MILLDWTECIYIDDAFVETIECSELFTNQSDCDAFIEHLDPTVCSNICQTTAG